MSVRARLRVRSDRKRVPLRELALALAVVAVVGRAAEKTVLRAESSPHKRTDGTHAVLPGELLALGPAARVVVNRDFVDAITESQDSGSDVRLNIEARAAQAQPAP